MNLFCFFVFFLRGRSQNLKLFISSSHSPHFRILSFLLSTRFLVSSSVFLYLFAYSLSLFSLWSSFFPSFLSFPPLFFFLSFYVSIYFFNLFFFFSPSLLFSSSFPHFVYIPLFLSFLFLLLFLLYSVFLLHTQLQLQLYVVQFFSLPDTFSFVF